MGADLRPGLALVRRLPNAVDIVDVADDEDGGIARSGRRSAEAERRDLENVRQSGPSLALVGRHVEAGGRRRVRAVALNSSGEKEVAGFARRRHDFRVIGAWRKRAGIDFCPGLAAVSGFENAVVIKIERIRQHAIGGDGARVEIIGPVEIAPTRHPRKRDRIPGLAAVERVIGIHASRRRPDEVLRGAGGDRAADEGGARPRQFCRKFRPCLAAVGRVARFLRAPPIGDADDEARRRRGIVNRPAGDHVVGLHRAVGRGIGVQIADIKERTIPGCEDRLAARRHEDFIGDEIFDADAHIRPDQVAGRGQARSRDGHIPDAGARGCDQFIRSRRTERHAADGEVSVSGVGACALVGRRQPGNVGRRQIIAFVDPAPGRAAVVTDVQIVGRAHRDDFVRIVGVDRNRLDSVGRLTQQLGPHAAGVAPQVRPVGRIIGAGAGDRGVFDVGRAAAQFRPGRAAVRALVDAVAVARGEDGLCDAVNHTADRRIEQNSGDAGVVAAVGSADRNGADLGPALTAVGRDKEAVLRCADVNDVGIVWINGHFLTGHTIRVVRIFGDLRERGLRPGRALVRAREHIAVEHHVHDVRIARRHLNFVDALA